MQIWIARWLRVRPSDLVNRYACDPRRLYEIWEETHFRAAGQSAGRCSATAIRGSKTASIPGAHRRVSKAAHPDQMTLFWTLSSSPVD